jgi:hypothetical protein
VLPWRFFLEGEDSHGDHGVGSLVELRFKAPPGDHIHKSPSTSSGQRNCASWESESQKSVTLRPQPGEETTKSIRDMWWHWGKKYVWKMILVILELFPFQPSPLTVKLDV